ncbi:MAG: tetratricopeptide repeat protein [Cyclobacteriaceae bacterium]
MIFLIFNLIFSPLNEPKPDSVLVLEYCDVSYSYILKNQDSAIFYGEKAIALAKAIEYPKGLAQGYNDLGFVYYYQSKYDDAKDLWLAALEIRKGLNDNLGIAALYNKLGSLEFQIGWLDESLKHQFLALEVYEKIDHKEGIAKGYNNIASVYESQGNLDLALEYYLKAIEIKEEIEDYLEIGGSMLNVGNVYLRKNDLLQARYFLLEAIHILESNEFEYSIYNGSALNNLSRVYHDLDSLDAAEKAVEKSILIRNKLGDQQGIISCQLKQGMIAIKKGNLVQAEKSLTESVNASKEKGLLKEQRDGYELLSNLHRKKGNFSKALDYSDQYHQLKDAILNENSIQKISQLQTKYETEKKEQQIALQKLEIAEQKAQNQKNVVAIVGLGMVVISLVVISLLIRSRSRKKQSLILQEAETKLKETQIEAALDSQESERKRFARDLHDGFGQMISVLNLNLKSLEKGTSSKEEVFENSSKVLDEMYKELKGICFNLMPETLIKNGVVDAVKEFANRVNDTGKVSIEVDTFGMSERLQDLQEISIYRICQEWVNNVLKYSDADKITIGLTKDEDELTLLIEDNGTGFEKSELTDGSGNGWKNMNSRANLIKGDLELDTVPNRKGNALIVNAPVSILKETPGAEIPA